MTHQNIFSKPSFTTIALKENKYDVTDRDFQDKNAVTIPQIETNIHTYIPQENI